MNVDFSVNRNKRCDVWVGAHMGRCALDSPCRKSIRVVRALRKSLRKNFPIEISPDTGLLRALRLVVYHAECN